MILARRSVHRLNAFRVIQQVPVWQSHCCSIICLEVPLDQRCISGSTPVTTKDPPHREIFGIGLSCRQFSSSPGRCWRCQFPLGRTPFCEQCGSIQPLDSDQSLFDVLGMEASFDVDLQFLQSEFRRMQMKLHPDRFASSDSIEQFYSAEQSSKLNTAYTTLKNPLTRAKYMLKLKGVEEDEGTIDDPEVLMEAMESQEKISELTRQDEIREMEKETQGKVNNVISQLSKAFQADDVETVTKFVTQLTYLSRLMDQINQKTDVV